MHTFLEFFYNYWNVQNSFKTTETQIATETWANYRHFISPIPSGNILDDSHLQSRLDIGLSEVRLQHSGSGDGEVCLLVSLVGYSPWGHKA